MSKNNSIGKKIIIIFRIISAIVIILCLIVLYKWHRNNVENQNIVNELGNFVNLNDVSNTEDENQENNERSNEILESKLEVNFEKLKNRNSDTVAWVRVNNTNIDFPVVKAEDNNFYLKKNFDKEANGAGWIFADFRNTFPDLTRNTIIYGHNRRNGTMFGNLLYLLDENWNFENENSYFYFATEKASYKAQIFSVYMKNADELSLRAHEFANDAEFLTYVQSLKEQSIREFNVEINKDDKIITLCTCDNTNKNRIVVHGRLVEQ